MTANHRDRPKGGAGETNHGESPPESPQYESERKILYITTNDITDPARGCDRRSYQLKRWLSDWNLVCSVSYVKAGGDGETDSDRDHTTDRDSTTNRDCAAYRDHTIRYPRSKLLAPFDPRVLSRVLRLRDHHRFDWVVASGLGSFLYGILAAFVFGSRLVVDLHNAEHVLSKEIGDVAQYLLAVSIGNVALRLADVVVFTSEHDRSHYSERVKDKSVIVSNGFDSETFFPRRENTTERNNYICEENENRSKENENTPKNKESISGSEEQETDVLFFGNMAYPPNEEAVGYIAHELVPRLGNDARNVKNHVRNVNVLIAGPHCDEIADTVSDQPSVRVLGLVDDIADRIRDADVVVVPLKKGSGTRLKIIESLACGTPVISTPKGAEGWPERWENLVVVEAEEFADRLSSFLDSPADFDHDEMKRYARFSWEEQVKKVDDEMGEIEETSDGERMSDVARMSDGEEMSNGEEVNDVEASRR